MVFVNLDEVRLFIETNQEQKWMFTRIWFWSYSLEPYPTPQSLHRIARKKINMVVTDQVQWTWSFDSLAGLFCSKMPSMSVALTSQGSVLFLLCVYRDQLWFPPSPFSRHQVREYTCHSSVLCSFSQEWSMISLVFKGGTSTVHWCLEINWEY